MILGFRRPIPLDPPDASPIDPRLIKSFPDHITHSKLPITTDKSKHDDHSPHPIPDPKEREPT
jgi:hypothetical protein